MSKRNNLTGQQFDHLTVIGFHPRKTDGCRNSQWLCRCDCGNLLIVRCDNLMKGRTTQCSECRGTGGRKSVFVKDVIEIDNQI
jgi:predicted SprT family Zn-dependent metalloprotease